MLTKKQKMVLDFMQGFFSKKGYSPSFDEIRKHFKLASVSTVNHYMKSLEEKGYLTREKNTARGVKVGKQEGVVNVPFKGYISAGKPILAIEEYETITVPQNMVANSGEHFALGVKGNSMIDEGIFDGDTVIIKKQNTVENGETAVALINGNEVTLKKIFKEKNRIRLQPANPALKPLYVKTVIIQGKVVSVLRNIDEQEIQKKSEIANISETKPQKPYFEADKITIYQEDILKITAISENSVDLIITSPPYNVDIHYNSHADNLSYEDYLEFTQKWVKKCFDLARNEGRFLLNIPLDKNKGGQKSVGADITKIAKDVGWKYHSTIIWNEGNISRRTAWGSFMSASAPYVIAPVELILVLYKDSWKKTGSSRENDITKKEFMDWTNGVWTFNGQSKKGAGGHPAPFPIELPRRCIKLFSFIGDTILDPFLGSGSTLIASYLHDRQGIGIDIDKSYCDVAIQRLQKEANINQSSLLK